MSRADETRGGGGHLLRVLGTAFGIAAVIGGTIGQGILRSPGLVASGVGDARVILLLWLTGGVVAGIDAMSTVELAASIRRTGGPYAFATRAFGRIGGLAVGCADWLGYVGVAAFLAVIFGEYLHRLGIAGGVPINILALLLIATTGAVQALGTRIGGASQEIGSAIKAALFLVLVAALLLARRGEAVAAAAPAPAITLLGLIVAIRAIVGTYLGWNQAAYYGEEVKDPGRTIVRATFAGIALVTVIYLLVNIALLSVLSPQEMAGSNLVAADAAARVFGPRADMIVTAISLISLVTILNLSLMTYPRLLFAIGRDAGVPGLRRVARNGTPMVALGVMVVAAALLATIGVYTILLAFSTWLTTAVAASVNVAALVVRRREPDLARPYRMPWFPVPALVALAVNGALLAAFLYEAPGTALKACGLLIVVVGAVVVATRRRPAW